MNYYWIDPIFPGLEILISVEIFKIYKNISLNQITKTKPSALDMTTVLKKLEKKTSLNLYTILLEASSDVSVENLTQRTEKAIMFAAKTLTH